MSAQRAPAANFLPKTPAAPRKDAAREPSFAPAVPESAGAEARTPSVIASTSRISGKVRGLVERHPEEALSVLRRWMEERASGG
ncbi:MAG: hypothetical protein AAB223_07725 [Pseudomonadota bacterium]